MDSPILWVGGKKKLAQQIIAHFPKHRCYVEPFFGAGWIFFKKEPSKVEIIDDLNQSLIIFWKVVQDENKLEEFKKRIKELLISEQLFHEFRVKTKFKDDIEQAVCFYYVLKLSWSARERETIFGTTTKMASKFLSFYNTDWKKIMSRLRRVTILNRDAIDVIKSYDSEDTLFYCDPPYIVTEEREDYKFQDSFLHQRLLNCLKDIKGNFLLSYDYLPEVEQMYSWANIITMELKYGMGNIKASSSETRRVRKEYLVANFDISGSSKLESWFK